MQKTEDPKAKLVVILLAGLLFISFGIVAIIIQNSIKSRCTIPVDAVMINSTHNVGRKVAPMFEYTYLGDTYKSTDNVRPTRYPYSKGDKVRIYINPKNYNDIYVPGTKKNTVGVSFIIFGALFSALAYISYRQEIKKQLE